MTAPIAGAALLLSDLHLPDDDSPLREVFTNFIDGPARAASAIYLLGDLFEHWVGDDVGLAAHAPEVDALRRLTTSGVPVFVMLGNRDFLLGKRFAAATGVKFLPDPVVIKLAGECTLLSHGDLLCTADVGYQRWRWFSHNRLFQSIFLRFPSRWRLRIAGSLRKQSGDATRRKTLDILDVEASAVEQAFRDHGVDRIVHGHTHRPDDHGLVVDGRARRRFVLADWRNDRAEIVLAATDGVLTRLELPVGA